MFTSKKKSGRRERNGGQSSVTSTLSNNCNNLVYSVMGNIFGAVKQRCSIG